MRRWAAVAAVAAATAVTVGSASAQETPAPREIRGEQRVLVVLATWGPQPFTREEVRRVVFDEAAAFFRASSYGLVSLTGAVTEWVLAFRGEPNCDAQPTMGAARAAAVRAGYEIGRYERVIYVQPFVGCAFSGVTAGRDVLLDGELTSRLVVHELGHTFGLGHANVARCFADYCTAIEYGDPYDTMGSGSGDFNAWEKFRLGWLPRLTAPIRNGTFTIHELERPAQGPQALVVPTAREEYWFEHRGEPARTRSGVDVAPAGVLVRIGPPQVMPNGLTIFTTNNALIDDPSGHGRPAMQPGDRFAVDGAFTLSVLSRRGGEARVRFAWTDTQAPRPPKRLEVEHLPDGSLGLAWPAADELGSGVARYELRIGDVRRVVAGMGTRPVRLSLPPLRRGRHTISIVAVDRAGNRSAPLRRRVAGRG